MAQAKVKISRLVDNIGKTNVYTPLIEAVVNSIDSVNESGREDGEIVITLHRSQQESLDFNEDDVKDNLKPITGITIKDNGVGFTPSNLEAFTTVYTERKIRKGGKGFGRFVFLKYFDDVSVDSIYIEGKIHKNITFNFVKDDNIIQNDVIAELKQWSGDRLTTIKLSGLKKEQIYRLDKKIDTIARKLLENLLVYFVLDDYVCPKIIIKDEEYGDQLELNSLVNSDQGIVELKKERVKIETPDKSEKKTFDFKVFKVYYGSSRSSLSLVADNRQVTDEALHAYLPEFRGEFYEDIEKEKGKTITRGYTVKIYITGGYLDENVSTERDGFDFGATGDLMHPLGRVDIEREVADKVRTIFGDQVQTRNEKKNSDIKSFIENEVPWHRAYITDDDISSIPYGLSDFDLHTELTKIKHKKELEARASMKGIIENKDKKDVAKRSAEIVDRISDLGKAELAHYVALRKVVIELFKDALTWSDDQKYEREDVIHNIIFPQKGTSDKTPYDDHNLWLLDEKLSYAEYVSSDNPLNKNDDRPDLLCFDKLFAFQSGEDASNPIVVFEFKKPQRKNYSTDEDPLKQVARYVKKIRNREFTNHEGRPLNTNEHTPAFGYIVCDLTSKIEAFCEDFGLTRTSDGLGYVGYHPNHKIYYEVVSFDRMVRDSEVRNKIFFKYLGIV